jgi:apolipoprotein N-acyltransferase
LAFFFSAHLGFCVLLSLSLIFYFFNKQKLSFKAALFYGFTWGILVFSVHFIWLLILLLEKINACKSFALFSYSFTVFYFSLTSALWLCALSFLIEFFANLQPHTRHSRLDRESRQIKLTKLASMTSFCFAGYTYFYFLESYSLWFLGRLEGYPFLNPLIPLINFRLFMKILICFGFGVQPDFGGLKNTEFIHLTPEARQEGESWVDAEYKVLQELCKLKLWERTDQTKKLVVLAPESAFPFPLNKYQSAIELWSNVLPKNTHLFIGSQYKYGEKLCQSVYWIHQRRIKNIYVKKHRVPFVEKIPKFYRNLDLIRKVFLGDVCQFSRAKALPQAQCFELSEDIIFIPQICSELFFSSSYKTFSKIKKEHGKQAFIAFFVNDSWFTGYFKRILYNSAKLKSILSGVPLIYVGHECLKY